MQTLTTATKMCNGLPFPKRTEPNQTKPNQTETKQNPSAEVFSHATHLTGAGEERLSWVCIALDAPALFRCGEQDQFSGVRRQYSLQSSH